MTATQEALYYLMEENGYSHGLCTTALQILSQSKQAIDDAILFIEDNHPGETEFIAYIAELCGTD